MPAKVYAKPSQSQKENYDNLPTNRPVAVYYRQSTENQVGNEQTAIQQEDLPRELVDMGWRDIDILVIADDEAVSGTLDIDERIGMSRLFDMINADEIGAVAIVSVNRAFREEKYGDQASKFVRACAEHSVIVIVPDEEPYIFHHPRRGEYFCQKFQDEAREGGKYIRQHIKGKMLKGRKRKALRGLWATGSVPVGYMVTNGKEKKFVPFEPIAAAIRVWYALFLQYKGNLAQTWKHIRDHGPYLRDFDDPALYAELPKNADGTAVYRLKKPSRMEKRNGHYFPSKSGLIGILTNVAYIGHATVTEWEYPDAASKKRSVRRPVKTTLIKNNHSAIVDLDVFMTAFNYLSKITIDGAENPDYQKSRTTRPQDTDDPRRADVPRPFLESILYSPDADGNLREVLPIWRSQIGRYQYQAYLFDNKRSELTKPWAKSTDQIDNVVHDMLALVARGKKKTEIVRKLEAQQPNDAANLADQRTHYQNQIKYSEKVLAETKMRWQLSTEPELIKDAEAAYVKVKKDIARYQDELRKIDAIEADQGRMAELRVKIFKLTADYRELSSDDKRLVLQLLVERVEARKQGDDLEITVVYRGGATDTRVLGLHGDDAWTSAEGVRLRDLINQDATTLEVMAAFPSRTLSSIIAKGKRESGKCLSVSNCPARRSETFWTFIDRQPKCTEFYNALIVGVSKGLTAFRVYQQLQGEIGDYVYSGEIDADMQAELEAEYAEITSYTMESPSKIGIAAR